MKYIKSLDGIRFLAVSLVLLDHWSGHGLGFPAGYLGVCIFFVLSGFLITNILINSKQKDEAENTSPWRSWRVFFIRRTIRIFPLYYLVLLIAFLLGEQSVQKFWLQSISYTTNFYIAFNQTWMGVIDHLWSLAVEEQFYLFFPFVVLFLPLKHLPKIISFLILLSVVLRLALYLGGFQWMTAYVLMPTCLDAFGLGAILAYCYQMRPSTYERLKQKGLLILVSAMAIYWYLTQFAASHGFNQTVFLRCAESLLAVGLILLITKKDSIWDKIFSFEPFVFIGKISYGIYLIHNFVYNEYHSSAIHPVVVFFQNHLEVKENMILKIGILYAMTMLIATGSWYIFEKPVNKLKDRFIR